MPQGRLQADAIGLPVTREQVEAQISLLIDLLDTLDADPDAEPSLGWQTGNQSSEHHSQAAIDFCGDDNSGDDREDEHDGAEPTEDGEASLGWRNEGSQTGYWAGNPLVGIDLEDEHDGAEPEDDSEPDVDDEPTGGWEGDNQDARDRFGIGFGGTNVTGQLA